MNRICIHCGIGADGHSLGECLGSLRARITELERERDAALAAMEAAKDACAAARDNGYELTILERALAALDAHRAKGEKS